MKGYKQLTFFPDSSMQELFKKVGFDPRQLESPDTPDGKPKEGEYISENFFPYLSRGFPTKNGLYKIEVNNDENPYEIDRRIKNLLTGEIVGWYDAERRGNEPFGGDYPFLNNCSMNIQRDSLSSKKKHRKDPERSIVCKNKIIHFFKHPDNSFHLTIRYTLKEAFCCWAADIIDPDTSPLEQQYSRKYHWSEWVFRVPRERACYGEEHQHEIENFVLRILIDRGFIT